MLPFRFSNAQKGTGRIAYVEENRKTCLVREFIAVAPCHARHPWLSCGAQPERMLAQDAAWARSTPFSHTFLGLGL